MKTIESSLKWIWLEENETKIYLALLELWQAWVSSISKKSWIKRTTIYNYLDELLKKDIIKRTIKWKRILFRAEDPKNLVKIFEKRKNTFLEKLPFLENLYDKNSPNPQLEYYEWKNWIKNIYNKIWSSWEDVLAFFSPEAFSKYFSIEYEKELWKLSEKYWWITKNLLQNNQAGRDHIKSIYTSNKSKLLPKWLELEVDLLIIKNTVIMVSYMPMIAVSIKNKSFADFHRNMFNYFWRIL